MTMEFHLDGKVILPGEMYRWNLDATPGATTLSASITGKHMDLVGKPISILDDSGFTIFTGVVSRISSDGRSTDLEAIDDVALRWTPAKVDEDQMIIDMVIRDSLERAERAKPLYARGVKPTSVYTSTTTLTDSVTVHDGDTLTVTYDLTLA